MPRSCFAWQCEGSFSVSWGFLRSMVLWTNRCVFSKTEAQSCGISHWCQWCGLKCWECHFPIFPTSDKSAYLLRSGAVHIPALSDLYGCICSKSHQRCHRLSQGEQESDTHRIHQRPRLRYNQYFWVWYYPESILVKTKIEAELTKTCAIGQWSGSLKNMSPRTVTRVKAENRR